MYNKQDTIIIWFKLVAQLLYQKNGDKFKAVEKLSGNKYTFVGMEYILQVAKIKQ